MSDFTDRIRRVTADLQQLLAELDRAAHTDASGQETAGRGDQGVSQNKDQDAMAKHREQIQRELLVPGTIHDFKTAVDDMRMMLWTYMSVATGTSGPSLSFQSVEARLQSVRMQRVTDMLKTLKPDVASGSTHSLPESTTFFALIHDIANTTLDRHAGH